MHARGEFAWIFAASPEIGGDAVALKVLPPHYVGDARLEARFHREAALAANLLHPNIVRILDVGCEGGVRYFAMPLHPHSLASLLAQHGPMDERAAARMGRDVAAGLAYSHAAGVVHRDIKPGNILLCADGSAVIADFGIARSVREHLAISGATVTFGTPYYTSPEQAQGRPVDGRSDLYSLGVVLFRATTGAVPFHSTDWFELARMHVEDTPPRLRTRAPQLTADFERIVRRCLEKDPDDRYGSATDLTADLDELWAA